MKHKKFKKPKINRRFEFDYDNPSTIVDNKWNTLLECSSKSEAKKTFNFLRTYVKEHGDVSLCSVPYSYDQPFTNEQLAELQETYDEEDLINMWVKWGGWL
jgi:hypothetical protein